MKLKYLLIPALALSLTGCYVNQAGYTLSQREYKACVNVLDAMKDKCVLTDGSNYYLELPRYRKEPGAKQMYDVLTDWEADYEYPRKTGDTEIMQIPADFAAYLTGAATEPEKPSSITRVDDPDAVRRVATKKLPIVNKPLSSWTYFDYKAPSTAGIYTAAALKWLLLDLPLTPVATALDIVFGPILILGRYAESQDEDEQNIKKAELAAKKLMQKGDELGYITKEEATDLASIIDWAAETAEIHHENMLIGINNRQYYNERAQLYGQHSQAIKSGGSLLALGEEAEAASSKEKYKKLNKLCEKIRPWLDDMYARGRVR